MLYLSITDRPGADPGEIFFIDDVLGNIDSAAVADWQTFHFAEQTRGELIARLVP